MRLRRREETKPFDVTQLEREVRDAMPPLRAIPPPEQFPTPLPPLEIEPKQVSAEDLARITGEAVRAAHETAAKSLDDLCKDAAERVERIEQLKAIALKQIQECRELAEVYREQGRLSALQIETTQNDLSEMRETIDLLRNKIKKI